MCTQVWQVCVFTEDGQNNNSIKTDINIKKTRATEQVNHVGFMSINNTYIQLQKRSFEFLKQQKSHDLKQRLTHISHTNAK